VKVTRDGRRQIFAFLHAGDMCGLEPDDAHGLTIEAVSAGNRRGAVAAGVPGADACAIRNSTTPFSTTSRAPLSRAVDHMTMVGGGGPQLCGRGGSPGSCGC